MLRIEIALLLVASLPSALRAQSAELDGYDAEPGGFTIDLSFGAGTYEHDTQGDGGTASGDTDAGYFRLRGEYVGHSWIGAGLSLEAAASDDDLFTDVGSPDVEGSIGDLFLYVVGVPVHSTDFVLPIRFGPYFHNVNLEDPALPAEIDWTSFGLRVEIEPEYWLVQRSGFSLGFVGDLSLGLHVTAIDAKITGISEDFDGNGATVGLGFGVQALFAEHFTTKLGYVFRATAENESDTVGGVFVREATASFRGLALQFGARF